MRLLPADIKKAREYIEEVRCLFSHIDIDSDLSVPNLSQSPCSKTYGCGAGTTTLVLNPNLSVSACDLLTEEDRTGIPLSVPEEIDHLWQKGSLFQKWRGLDPCASTSSIPSFEGGPSFWMPCCQYIVWPRAYKQDSWKYTEKPSAILLDRSPAFKKL